MSDTTRTGGLSRDSRYFSSWQYASFRFVYLSLVLYSQAKCPFFQTSAHPCLPSVCVTPRSKVNQVPSGSASVGVGCPSKLHRSLKCDWTEARSESVVLFHLAMNAWGAMRDTVMLAVLWRGW